MVRPFYGFKDIWSILIKVPGFACVDHSMKFASHNLCGGEER